MYHILLFLHYCFYILYRQHVHISFVQLRFGPRPTKLFTKAFCEGLCGVLCEGVFANLTRASALAPKPWSSFV